jgi:hypothetical protein
MNNFDLLTENEKAFVKAIASSAGVPKEATIEYILASDEDDFSNRSPHGDWCSLIGDCRGVWFAAIEFSEKQMEVSNG